MFDLCCCANFHLFSLIAILRQCECGILQNQFVTQSYRCALLICIDIGNGDGCSIHLIIFQASQCVSLNIDNLYNSFQFIQKRMKLFIEFGTCKIAMHLPLVDYVYQFFFLSRIFYFWKVRWILAFHLCGIGIAYLICIRVREWNISPKMNLIVFEQNAFAGEWNCCWSGVIPFCLFS